VKKPRFYWKSTCSTCRNARSFILDELGVQLDEHNYAKEPLSLDELRELFKGADPRDFVNPKSPAFKAMGLRGKTLTAEDALKLMNEEPNLLKRPLTLVGRTMIAGCDRDRLRAALK